jgi:hypothetical protein
VRAWSKGVLETEAVAAIEANLAGSLLALGEAHCDRRLSWVATGKPLLNRVFDAHLDADAAETITQVRTFFDARRVQVHWLVGPSSEPTDLGALLEQHGFERRHDWTGMALDLSELASREPTDGLAVERVDGKAGVRTWAAMVSAAFGIPKSSLEAIFGSARPGYRHFVGRLNGEPVSSVSLFVDAKSVGVYWVGTVPTQRSRGLASATIASALRDGADVPQLAVLHATDAATGIYQRLGFRPCAPIGVYVHRPGRQ